MSALLAGASFDVRRSPGILQEMWEKFTFITAAGAITCLMRVSVRAIMATQDWPRLIEDMLGECNAVAEAAGLPFGPRPASGRSSS